jgi:hypothetical protein
MSVFALDSELAATRWSDIDLSVLEENRGAVPPFPLDLLPQPWRDWVSDTASSTGAPVDYVAQAVLAGLAGPCGAGVTVRITPVWCEPLVLWLMAVGGPSAGKSRALAPLRRLLGSLEQGDAPIVVAKPAAEAVADIVRGNPRGMLLWRDQSSAWLGEFEDHLVHWLQAWAAGAVTIKPPRAKKPLELEHFAVSILGTIQPDRLHESDDGLAACFLYAWPGAQPYRSLADRKTACDDEALKMLGRISGLARVPGDPLVLSFDAHGVEVFDGFLAGLHFALSKSDGPEAAWLAKGRATVARLAGALELLAWSGSGVPGLPGLIGGDRVEAAAALWTSYFQPHARAVFDRAVPSDHERRVRRVARWLKDEGAAVVSREDIRRRALSQTVDASDTDHVLQRLHYLGFVRPDRCEDRQVGRPAQRWQVNPALEKI